MIICLKRNNGAIFITFMSVNDLNKLSTLGHAFRTYQGGSYVRWQTHFRPSDGICALAYFPSYRGEAARQLQYPQRQLSGSFPVHGLCPTDIQGKFEGHRSLSPCPISQTIPLGHSWKGQSQCHSRCHPSQLTPLFF